MKVSKKGFIESLARCYTRLAATEHGVGVIAIVRILKSTDPFFRQESIEYATITNEDLQALDVEIKKLVIDMCAKQGGVYYVPAAGIATLDNSYYLNHSKSPNMETKDEGETFVAKRDIEVGEELTVDYRTYDESREEFLT